MDGMKEDVVTKKIELSGIVQGIGFRPFVFRLAEKHHLTGYVKNISGSLEIIATGDAADIDTFINDMLSNPPAHSCIEKLTVTDVPRYVADSFSVFESDVSASAQRFFSPDLAMCSDCRAEVFDKDDRRYRHFFNNCVSCGPRFSVLTAFPYDRINTSMDKFEMCPHCLKEYRSVSDRRFHAETIACHYCGPTLFYMRGKTRFEGDDAFEMAVKDLEAGGIVAIKGIGGYHFACLPTNKNALRQLRVQKGRDFKPFAIMFRSIEEISKVCALSEDDINLLISPAHPIVLLHINNHPFAEEAIFDCRRCGCFLPYTPLQEMILDRIPCLVMTSANISSNPIIKDDDEMKKHWEYVLYNDREIVRSVEDSVVQRVFDSIQIIRRARGYVPLTLEVENPSQKNILAMGGDLKAAFSLTTGKYCTLSQFFGDLENAGVAKQYKEGIFDLMCLFDVKPDLIVCDSHPRYFSSQIAAQLAKDFDIPLTTAYHHHAHIASVMAENGLKGGVIGVAFDGSGFGEDGNIWGGEFLICENEYCKRVAHLEYTPLLGADAAAKDARATAACFLHSCGLPFEHSNSDIILAAMSHSMHTFLSSSVGRLFDAVSSIINVCHKNSYEGQCATALQYCAEEAYKCKDTPVAMAFSKHEAGDLIRLEQKGIIGLAALHTQNSGPFALGFHLALADMVLDVCIDIRKKYSIGQVALSGGVFQNSLLLSLCCERLLCNGFSVYINSKVPTNDSGITLGQSYIASNSERT